MNSSMHAGNPDVIIAGPPPPPPPPPPMSGQLPSLRINTTENAAAKRSQMVNNDVYEPPAAIQNAMLTKDKKPFTYTPGMGGKLDLSQIRSPRMARRVAKNANDEGIEGPPKLVESKPSTAVPNVANFMVQPQVAIPVFPTNVPVQTHVNKMSSTPLVNRTSSNAADKQAEASKNITKIDTKIDAKAASIGTPESPDTPTQVTLAKAPTPWMQNKIKPQEELPDWAKRACNNKIGGDSSLESIISTPSPQAYVQVQQTFPQHSETKPKQEQERPTPQSQQPRSQQPPRQYQQQQSRQERQSAVPVTSQQINPQSHQHERIVPIRIEDRPSVFDVKRDPDVHHQFKQPPPTLHHQQRWGQMPGQYQANQNRPQDQERSQIRNASSPRSEQSVGTTYIIPVVMKDDDKKAVPSNAENNTIEKTARIVQQRNSNPVQQHEAGPIQSRSFRVLQKITDTDAVNDVGAEQIRKLELSEDERLLMSKFKEQVDHETYLHQEEDPRYRGAAIPSRAFRFLQNMTDSSDAAVTCAAPRNIQNVANKKQNRNSKSFEETQTNLPPSEQQVQEPKKYMGSAIPSRSFRILQAMTASESNATQENRQADYTCRTENNLPSDQQGVFLPLPQPVPVWYPEGWWSYYPVTYNVAPDASNANITDGRSFPLYAYPNGRTYVGPLYPTYDENFTNAMTRNTSRENPSGEYVAYAAVIYPSHNEQVRLASHVAGEDILYDYAPRIITSESDESRSAVLPSSINHLDAQSSETYNPKNVNESSDREKNYITTAMNITDEEESLSTDNNTTDNNLVAVNNVIEMPEGKTIGSHINVPNYTYIDTSDSSASSDSNESNDGSDSISDNEQLSDTCRKNRGRSDDTTFTDTSSDSDSDSYVAYSTSVNPYENPRERDPRDLSLNEDCNDVATATASVSANHLCERSRDFPENFNHKEETRFRKERIDCADNHANSRTTLFRQNIASGRSDDENSTKDHPINNLDSYSGKSTGDRHPEQRDRENLVSGVDRENAEQPYSENPYYKGKENVEAFFEATDDPPDVENTMVSVSLPLRFKFFVSEDNEDITTVIVGDSKIKAEKSREYSSVKDDVRVNFRVGNDTSVDFTVKTHPSDASTRDEVASNENAIPHVDFTLRKNFTEVNGERNEKTELAVAKTENDCEIDSSKSASKDDEIDISETVAVMRDNLLNDENRDCTEAKSTCNDVESNVLEGTIAGSKLATLERSSMDDDFRISDFQIADTNNTDRRNCAITTDEKCIDRDFCRAQNAKHLSSVQDSREDTDDEDSGVTSDISRMISEVDTDSEGTCSKNVKKYQRTQTHSRLFRLLNDDSVLSEGSRTNHSGRERLSLPLETNAFNYDDNYCSNYSSGLTSPEYSPVHKQPWRRFHEDATTTNANSSSVGTDRFACDQHEQPIAARNDPYFRVWKSPKLPSLREHDAVPSLAFKTLDSKIPSWAYKVNVLCPRIKSAKNVPRIIASAEQRQD